MKWVDKYVGIPFESKGRSATACDCYGLLRIIYQQERGIELPLLLDYENTKDRKAMGQLVKEQPLIIGFQPVNVALAFDVLVIRNGGFDCHLGIAINKTDMIHTEQGKGAVIECFTRPHIAPRIRGIYTYVG